MGDGPDPADLEMEQLEEEDILEFLHSKGAVLDAFRREYLDMQKVCEECDKLYFDDFQMLRTRRPIC